jgi:hypothetical protein
MTRLTLALLLCASPALAEGCWDCEPDPPVTPPTVVTIPDGSGGSAYDPYARIYYGSCFCDGRFTTAFGFETYAFRKQAAEHQCRTLNVKRRCAVSDQSYVGGLK